MLSAIVLGALMVEDLIKHITIITLSIGTDRPLQTV